MNKNIIKQPEAIIAGAVSENNITVQKMLSVYCRATGSKTRQYDHYLRLQSDIFEENSIESDVCRHCPMFSSDLKNEPCRELHINAIEESTRSGGIEIYSCRMGLMFWTSPLFNEGCYAGSLRGSGYVRKNAEVDTGQASGKFSEKISSMNRVDGDKIKSMAEMLLLCAASLSHGAENYHDMLRRRADQQQNIKTRLERLKAEGETTPGYPLNHEQRLVTALRNGDADTAASCLNDLLAILLFTNQDNFKYIQLRALELTALLPRAVNNSGYERNSAPHNNFLSVKQVKKAKTFEELTDTLHSQVKSLAGTIAPFRGIPHAAAMRKAERHIQENFTRKISLSEIASVAGLSAPYFSTIFKEEMGENYSTYINRLRVEKAKHMLLETDQSLCEIATACCFEDQSWFSRIFKTFTGISPGNYRKQGGVFSRL